MIINDARNITETDPQNMRERIPMDNTWPANGQLWQVMFFVNKHLNLRA